MLKISNKWKIKAIKYNAGLINDHLEGRLKITDITSFNKSLKATGIKKYQDTENCSKWKVLFNLELGKCGCNIVFQRNLNKKTSIP